MSATRKRFSSFTLDNGWNIDFPTEPAGVLRLGPGKVHIDARIWERFPAEDSWYTVLNCELRIADSAGKIWQATSSFVSRWLLYPLIDLSRKHLPRWLRNAPLEWREALKRRSLIRNIAATYDDRFYRHVWIDNTGFYLQYKYLPAGFEIAALTPERLVVRVDKLFCSWNPLPVAGPDGTPIPLPAGRRVLSDEEQREEEERLEESDEDGDFAHVPPLAYEIDAGRVLFHNTTHSEKDGEHVSWSNLPLSRPLVFRPVRGQGTPQPGVEFDAEATPAPSARADEGDESGFVAMTVQSYDPLEFLTDTGERLLVESGERPWAVRLDRQPGSDRELVDVLRCRVRLSDEAGNLWESVVLFTPAFFLEKLIDLHRTDLVVSVSTAPGPWAQMPGDLLRVRALIDDKVWRYFLTENELMAFCGDRQKPTVDVSLFSRQSFAVRISGLVGRRRPIETDDESRYFVFDPESHPAEPALWEQDQPLLPLVYELSFAELAFRNTTFAIDDGFWHQNAIPIPVVLTRVGKGATQPGVRLLPLLE
jgi:hypothetical protein